MAQVGSNFPDRRQESGIYMPTVAQDRGLWKDLRQREGVKREGWLVLLEFQAGGDDVVVAVFHGQAAGGGFLVQGR